MNAKAQNLVNLAKNIVAERGAQVTSIVEDDGHINLYSGKSMAAQVFPNAPANDKRFPQIEVFVKKA